MAPVAWERGLADVAASLRAADVGGLDRLVVNADGTGSLFTSLRFPHLRAQDVYDLRQRAIVSLLREVFVSRTLGHKIVRQHLPLTTGAIDVQHGIDHLSQIDLSRSATMFCRGRYWGNELPLSVCEISGVGLSRAGVHAGTPGSWVKGMLESTPYSEAASRSLLR